MEFDDFEIDPALLDGRIPAEVFYEHYIPHKRIPIDNDLLKQINIPNFNHFIEEVQGLYQIILTEFCTQSIFFL